MVSRVKQNILNRFEDSNSFIWFRNVKIQRYEVNSEDFNND